MEYFRRILAAIQSIVISVAMLIGFANNESDYKKLLDSSAFFDNQYDEALPQYEIYNIASRHFSAPLPEGKTEKKFLLIGFDGARAEAVLNAAEKASSGVLTLKERGGLYHLYTGGDFPFWQDTSTAPGWASMITGVWAVGPGSHGVTHNSVVKKNKKMTLMTNLYEESKIDSSAMFVSWGGHFVGDDATYKEEIKYTSDKQYKMKWETFADDAQVMANTLAEIEKPDCADVIFPILEYCDHVGHDTGYSADNPDYVNAYLSADLDAAELIAAVEARETYNSEDWLIIISSDHGGLKTGHGGISSYERRIFFASNKAID